MARRRQYSTEERAERDEKDAKLRDQARELIADPDKVAAMVAQMLAAASRRVLRYSLRNQALLTNQADERGTVLTDVDTFKGWQQRGRGVRRGESGYRIVRPVGREQAEGDDSAAENASADNPDSNGNGNGDGDGENPAKALFRMMTVFDISQTDGFDDEAEGYEPVTVDDPAAELRATLTDQLERLGYAIVPGDVDAAAIDDDNHQVTVPHGEPVPELARALAILVSRPKSERPTMSPPRRGDRDAARITEPAETTAPDGTQRVRLQVGDYGHATAHVVTHPDTGATRYIINGPRIAGTFTVTPSRAADTAQLSEITVRYGDHFGGFSFEPAEDLPTVNGITIIGGTTLTPDEVPHITHRRVVARRPTGPRTSTDAPQKTNERTAATVRAILTHWLDRPDVDQLHAAAARHAAPTHQRDAERTAANLAARIAELEADHAQVTARADHYAALATTGPAAADAIPDVTGDTAH